MGEQMDIDLQDMSQEQLESFINNAGQQVEETQDQEPESEPVEDTTHQEPEPEQEQEEPEAEPTGQTEDDSIPEFYRGKSASELVQMLEENKKFTSRQGNEIGQLRNELQSFKGSIEKKFDEAQTPQTKAEKKDFVDELIDEYGYDKKDVDIISRLVEHKTKSVLQQAEQERKQKTETERQQTSAKNQELWDNIKELYPNAQDMESAMIDEIRKGADTTLYKPGWVKSFVREYNSKQTATEPVKPASNGAKQRVAKTATVKGSTRPAGSNVPPKENLTSKTATADEYRAAWNYYNPTQQI